MGIVRKQGILSSIIINAGFILGAFNILFLFPRFLTSEEAGLIFLIVAMGKMILSFSTLGSMSIMNKFFPYYNAYLPKEKNDFLVVSYILPLIGFTGLATFMLFFKDFFFRKTIEKSPLFIEYYYIIFPFGFFLVIYSILETYSTTHYKTVVPTFLREIGVRLITTVLLLFLIIQVLDFRMVINLYSIMYLLLFIILLLYLRKIGELWVSFRISSITRRLKGKMFTYGGYIYGGVLVAALAENADVLIIGSITGLGHVALYQTAHFVTTLIQVPYRSLSAISTPIIAQGWKDKNISLIEQIYTKTALTQLIAGIAIFGVIWTNIDLLLTILGENFDGVKPVIFLLGTARLIDLAFGHNSEILGNSKYWRFNFLSYVLLVILFLPTNYFLVKMYGITGSAVSNLFSFFLFNIVRYLFIWKVIKLQPFSKKTLLTVFFGIFAYFISVQFSYFDNIWIISIIRTSLFSILFFIPLVFFSVSEDINVLLIQFKSKLFKK